MSNLNSELQQTINNLEKIRDSQDVPSNDLLASLDMLYEQQINLSEIAIQQSTDEYAKVTEAMKDASKKTKEAINDLAKLENVISDIAKVIANITKLVAV